MSPALLEAHSLTKHFDGTTAVSGVTLSVEPGEVVGLIGANGAGKTTLIRMLLGLLRPTSGTVTQFGHAPDMGTRGRVGYVPQGLGLYTDMTVAENLRFRAESYGQSDGQVPDNLALFADTLVRDLPVGVQRRVAFAAAVDHRPDLLVLDEPTSGTDPLGRAELWDIIRTAAEAGTGVLVTTHHMDEAEQCDRLLVLVRGELAAAGTVDDIVGSSTATVVDVTDWVEPYEKLRHAGLPVAVVGDTLRVLASREEVTRVLGEGIGVRQEPSTLEEHFVELASTPTRRTAAEPRADDGAHDQTKGRPSGARDGEEADMTTHVRVRVPEPIAEHAHRHNPRTFWSGLAETVTGRRSWLLIVAGLLLAGGLSVRGLPESSQNSPVYLPTSAETAEVDALLKQFPDGGSSPVLAVITRRDGAPLAAPEIDAATKARARMLTVGRDAPAPADQAPGAGAPIVAPDGRAAIVTAPVGPNVTGFALRDVVDHLRTKAADGLPAELQVEVTGGPAFGADIADAFDGADVRLLMVTALVVALLLILTYRSPVLWLVPLLVVALADRVAQLLAGIVADAIGWSLDGSTTGITSVLVFGAGTNYALLLVSRYRQELHRGDAGLAEDPGRERSPRRDDHRPALRRAVAAAAPAIVASNATVVVSLLLLVLALVPATRVLGISAATGLLVALVFVLLVLPSALTLAGPRLFWPFIPHPQPAEQVEHSRWYQFANLVARRPVETFVLILLVLSGCAAGLRSLSVGLDQVAQFRVDAGSVRGYHLASEHFPAGVANPTVVVARAPAGQVANLQKTIGDTPGVASVQLTGQSALLTRWQVVLHAAPATDKAFTTIDDLRHRLDAAAQTDHSDVWVGGGDARQLDAQQAAYRDMRLLIPLILALVLTVLFALLRALWAPLVLILSTTLSAAAALGLGSHVANRLLDRPGLDNLVPLLAVLFLIALGVDYTIFLATRAREETPEHGTRDGMVRAVALTGGVITSAGVVLAAVFTVLGVLPLIILGQLGTIVGLGILLDTFVVRTTLIPALFAWIGPRIWWPSRLARTAPVFAPEPVPAPRHSSASSGPVASTLGVVSRGVHPSGATAIEPPLAPIPFS